MLKLLIAIGLIVSLYSPGFAENKINIEQVGGISSADTSQLGDDNLIVGVTNTGTIDPNIAAFQENTGSSNSLTVKQIGNGNELGLFQKGNETLVDVTQSGGSKLGIHVEVTDTNSITVTQTGGADAKIIHGPAGGSFNCAGLAC